MGADFSVRGFVPDWASLEIQLGPYGYQPQIKDFSYKQKGTGKKVYGQGRNPIGRTLGVNECEASLTMYLAAWHEMVKNMGNNWGAKQFPIVCHYRMPGGLDIVTVELEEVTIIEPDFSASQGEEALEVKVGLDPMRIKENGVYMFADEDTSTPAA